MLLFSLLNSGILLSQQVNISAEFDSGSIGAYRLIDSTWIKRNTKDSLLCLTFDIYSRPDPVNPVDTALRPSARWYHFRLEGVKDKLVILNIHESEVIRPYYSYDGAYYQRFEKAENIYGNTINKIFTEDTVYIAHFFPYGYAKHLEKINEWKRHPFVKHEVIGESRQGLPIDMLTITDNSFPDDNKKIIWMHARVHTSEAPASWHLDAMIDELVSDTPFAKELRKNALFYIVPQANPDGIKGGYSRSTSTGVNIEINWDRPDEQTMPEVKALKKTLLKIAEKKPIDLALNLHSQIANSITYWIHTANSSSKKRHKEQMLLSALTINHTQYYRSEDQLFSNIAPRYMEGWLWNLFKDRTIAVTFETPYTYFAEDSTGTWVSTENLRELAHSSLLAYSDLLDLYKSGRLFFDTETIRKPLKKWHKTKSSYDELFFGESYLVADKEGASVKISFPLVEKGEYTICKWVVGPVTGIYPENTNRWEEIGKVSLKRDGKFSFRYRSNKVGERLDSILLIKD